MKNTRIIGSRKKGFTLIELLVVVAILALLLAMMTPALSRVRDRANTVKCAANLRAVGQGVMLWAADWHNRLPPYEISDVASDQQYAITALGGNAQAWSDYRLLGQYIGNERYQTGGGSGHSGGVVLKSSGAFCP